MNRGLIAVLVLGVLIALFPLIARGIDSALYNPPKALVPQYTTSPQSTESVGNVVILVPRVESHTGADTLVVTPGKALVPPNRTIDVTIWVYFKHSQPCPYSNWRVNYTVQGSLEVVSDDGGKLVNSKTYERVLKVRVLGPGKIVVTYYYGSGCPEGTMERVEVVLLPLTGNVTSVTTNSSVASTYTSTTTSSSGESYVKVSGIVESKDVARRVIVVSGKTVYVRGEWRVLGANKVMESSDVVEQIPVGAHVEVLCKLSGSGRLQAEKIVVNNETTYIRS